MAERGHTRLDERHRIARWLEERAAAREAEGRAMHSLLGAALIGRGKELRDAARALRELSA